MKAQWPVSEMALTTTAQQVTIQDNPGPNVTADPSNNASALVLQGDDLPSLHLIYGLVPLAVSFVAEQLRLAAADQVLEQRGLEGRADVERLPVPDQHALVRAILRREMGVMAASAGVVALLGIRAAGLL